MKRRRAFLLAITGAVCSVIGLSVVREVRAATAAKNDEVNGKAWWAHVQYLASDAMKGRLTGSPEYLKAAQYVVDQFKSYGLQPAGVDGGWYQPVHFVEQRVIAERSSLQLVVDGKPEPLTLGQDAILSSRSPQPENVDAQLVFLGYGLHLPDSGYDDFNSPEVSFASLRGKIIVVMNGGPADLPGALKSFARTSPMRKEMEDAGVVGMISVSSPKSMDFGWDRVASSASQPGMWLAPEPDDSAVARRHPALTDYNRPRFAATFNPADAEKLFAGSGHTFAEMLALADSQKPLPRFDLHKRLTANVSVERSTAVSPNIVAKLEGNDPQLSKQYVLSSAHLDHLGVGAPIHGKTIYNGAMDDASGVATVLETAQALGANAQRGIRPKRSVLFVIFTGEEKGLLGSRYYAGRPTVPEQEIKADLNLDMFMPLFALKRLHVQGLEQSTLGDAARRVGTAHSIEIAGDPEPDRNSFIRTDQYSFVQAGVPALAMKFGWNPGSPEYHAWRNWLAERYHSTADDLDQPVNLAAAAQFNAFYADLVREVANDANEPHYLESSFFRRFELGKVNNVQYFLGTTNAK